MSLKGVAKKNLYTSLITILLPFGGLSQWGAENMNVRNWISESKDIRHYYVVLRLKSWLSWLYFNLIQPPNHQLDIQEN